MTQEPLDLDLGVDMFDEHARRNQDLATVEQPTELLTPNRKHVLIIGAIVLATLIGGLSVVSAMTSASQQALVSEPEDTIETASRVIASNTRDGLKVLAVNLDGFITTDSLIAQARALQDALDSGSATKLGEALLGVAPVLESARMRSTAAVEVTVKNNPYADPDLLEKLQADEASLWAIPLASTIENSPLSELVAAIEMPPTSNVTAPPTETSDSPAPATGTVSRERTEDKADVASLIPGPYGGGILPPSSN